MAAQDIVLLDTNVLIEIIRKNTGIIQKCDSIGPARLTMTSISRCEFLMGSRNRETLDQNKRFLSKFRLLRMNQAIDEIFDRLIETYYLEFQPGIPDMIIAATALYHDIELYTLNKKDFRFIPGIKLFE
jgi:predicted nucleic acid-binding protein